MLRLGDAIELLQSYISANLNAVDRINQVCERYLKSTDPIGSLERVTFIVTTLPTGEGFIILPTRYDAIRGAVQNPTSTSVCGYALPQRNTDYEFQPGNLGMLQGSDPMRGIIQIQLLQTDNVTYLDSGLYTRKVFKVPVCPTEGSLSYFTLICKRAWLMLTNDDDVLPVWNVGALKLGLKALDKEDAEDYARAAETWEQGKTLLAQETDNATGSEALGKVQVDDDWCVGSLGDDGWGYGGWGWGGSYGGY